MIKMRYYDIVNGKIQRTETKSGDEIVSDIIARAGLGII